MRINQQIFIDAWRSLTNQLRPLPDFVVIGTQKAGTTSLYNYLKQNKKIKMALVKEAQYFDQNYHKGTSWYRSKFPLVSKNNYIVGENTPAYFFNPLVPKRLHKLLPNAKLLVLFRNPTNRAISHYYHEVKKGREALSIKEALLTEEERSIEEYEKLYSYEEYKPNEVKSPYKAYGVYLEQLKRFEEFYLKENILVLSSEELFSKPNNVMPKIYNFLGIDTDDEKIDFTPHNIGIKKDKIDEEVYQYLNEFYEPHNKALYKHIGINFNW